MINKKEILENIKIIALAGISVFLIRYFLFQPFLVSGQSMEPNFTPYSYLFVDEISYKIKNPQRGEVIVFKSPQNPSGNYLIKRIIGLPLETIKIEDGKITIIKNGESFVLKESYLPAGTKTSGNIEITLKENEYFVLGDNREYSFDSRVFGPVPKNYIIGKAIFRLFPIKDIDLIKTPSY